MRLAIHKFDFRVCRTALTVASLGQISFALGKSRPRQRCLPGSDYFQINFSRPNEWWDAGDRIAHLCGVE